MLSSRGDGCLFSTSVFTLPFSLRPRDRFGFSLVSAKRIHEVAVGVRSVLETPGEKDSGVTGSCVPWISAVRRVSIGHDPWVGV